MFGFSRFANGNFFSNDHNTDIPSYGQPFIHEYACYPVSFAGRDELEEGNKILLPSSALNELARLNITWPMLFEVSNSIKNKITHSGVLEFVAEEGTCYMPYWMMKNLSLQEGDLVSIMNTTLLKGSYVKLQPMSIDFLDISNPKAVLEKALRGFATLTTGDIISISYNNTNYKVLIVETKPSNAISIIETDIQVDFDAPPGYVDHVTDTIMGDCNNSSSNISYNEGEKSATIEKSDTTFSGSGKRLDGKTIKDKNTLIKKDSIENMQPWRNQLIGGIRTSNDRYQELINRGVVPGLIGKLSKN